MTTKTIKVSVSDRLVFILSIILPYAQFSLLIEIMHVSLLFFLLWFDLLLNLRTMLGTE